MSANLSVFISSTVKDFLGTRSELAAQLRARGYTVRTSESADFPVAPNLHSHDACLATVRNCSVFVLLVGLRFGGEYRGQGKSITWREWEEACAHKLQTIVLVEQRANEILQRVARSRRALAARHPGWDASRVERELAKSYPDTEPYVQNLARQQLFLDKLRKDRPRDNWVHLDWNGTPNDALRIVDSRCGSALAHLLHQDRSIRDALERENERLRALSFVSEMLLVGGSTQAGPEFLQNFALAVCAERRRALFGFGEGERYNLMIYALRGAQLVAVARAHHPEIKPRNRSWSLGVGHVGLAVQRNTLLVAGDLRNTAAFRQGAASDVRNYVSAVSVPLYARGDTSRPDGVLIVTSSRLDHFVEPDSPDVVTITMLASMLSRLGRPRAEETLHAKADIADGRAARISGAARSTRVGAQAGAAVSARQTRGRRRADPAARKRRS